MLYYICADAYTRHEMQYYTCVDAYTSIFYTCYRTVDNYTHNCFHFPYCTNHGYQ